MSKWRNLPTSLLISNSGITFGHLQAIPETSGHYPWAFTPGTSGHFLQTPLATSEQYLRIRSSRHLRVPLDISYGHFRVFPGTFCHHFLSITPGTFGHLWAFCLCSPGHFLRNFPRATSSSMHFPLAASVTTSDPRF